MLQGPTEPISLLLKLVVATGEIQGQTALAIGKSPKLTADLAALEAATAYISALADQPSEPGSTLHNQQLLGLRVFNTSLSTLQLAASGFYQAGFAQLRDLLEVCGLLQMFRLEPETLADWATADDKRRRAKFRPVKVREFLEKRAESPSSRLQGHYETYSTYAAHATYEGFRLLGPSNQPKLGPFFDEKFFGHLQHDLALFTVRATGELLMLVGNPDQVTEDYVPAVDAFVAIQRGMAKSPGQR